MEAFRQSQAPELGISQNVFVAITLGLIASKNIIIRSGDWDRTVYETVWILRRIWGIKERYAVRCYPEMDFRELKQLLDGNEQDTFNISIIVGIELLSDDCQRSLVRWIRNGKAMVIGIVGIKEVQKSGLSDLLIREFWLSQSRKADGKNSSKVSSKEVLNWTDIKFQASPNTEKLIALQRETDTITVVSEIVRYIYDIVIHIRNHRCVEKGLPTSLIPQLQLLCRTLCVFFDKKYVIPTIVKLAARKLIPLHLKLVPPEHEPTLIYGSDIDLVKELMRRVTPEIIVEDVLRKVSVPL